MAISTLAKDNKSKLAIFRKLNSYKANLNKYKKCLWLELAAGTLMENSDNELVVYKR